MRCDGCGLKVSDQHIRERIERLELATRFRPIHINVLILTAAPPSSPLDYFYRSTKNPSERSVWSRMFFAEMMIAAGLPGDSWSEEETALAEFQHRGFFLAHSRECPFKTIVEHGREQREHFSGAEFDTAYGSTVIRRVKSSYKPKKVALLDSENQGLILLFEQAGLTDLLVLDSGRAFIDPLLNDSPAQAQFNRGLGRRLEEALATGTDSSAR